MIGAMKILAGNSNGPIAEAIAAYLGEPLTKCHVRRFADLEIFVEILENVRGRDAFIVQSTSYPTNDNLMELLIMIDALRRASAQRITAVIPYFGYARQDRKMGSRSPISAKLVANLITRADAGARHQGAWRPEQCDGGLARRRRRRARPRVGEAPRCAARHRRQAAR